MRIRLFLLGATTILLLQSNCRSLPITSQAHIVQVKSVVVGAAQFDRYLPSLKGKRVGVVVNATSRVGKVHLIDTLLSQGVDIQRIYAPEHGFRGNAADGEHVGDSVDQKTNITIVSLYGKNRKPTPEQMKPVDVMIFDIQDVGTRFYTYISTMHYIMEACAEANIPLIVLDRPNPNASYIDGPIREPELKSFVGMHPIPVVHGLTVGELAQMINGEGWLEGKKKCALTVITIQNWTHADPYSLPVRPSPNLPNDQAIRLYPSLCLFEGTVISVGRGTQTPFQVLGNPELTDMPYTFTPVTIKGMSNNPPHENKLCFGLNLTKAVVAPRIDLSYLLNFYNRYPDKDKFFIASFDRLAGTTKLKQQIRDGLTEDQIRETWKPGLDAYRTMREKYLIYK